MTSYFLTPPASFGSGEVEDCYGVSPAMAVLPDLKAWNELPPEKRAYAAARFIEEKMHSGEWDTR